MTNPYIAGAAAERYLTDLFGQTFDGGPEDTQKALAAHVLENVRRGEDGYPVLKIVGKNRLVFEFDLNVAPIGPKALAQTKQLVEGPGVPMTRESFAYLRHHVGSEETIKPADPERVEHPEAGLVAADRDAFPLPGEPNPIIGDGLIDAEIVDADPAEDLPHDQGYRSPWAEKGDAARAKRELPTDPTEADLPAPLDQESTTAQDAAGSSR